MGLGRNGTETQWAWDTMGLVHNGIGTQWDWYTMELSLKGPTPAVPVVAVYGYFSGLHFGRAS